MGKPLVGVAPTFSPERDNQLGGYRTHSLPAAALKNTRASLPAIRDAVKGAPLPTHPRVAKYLKEVEVRLGAWSSDKERADLAKNTLGHLLDQVRNAKPDDPELPSLLGMINQLVTKYADLLK